MKGFDGQTPFRELDHTADLCIEIVGGDEEDLFRNAAVSLYLVLGLPVVQEGGDASATETLRVHGGDCEEALVELLGELLYMVTVERQRFLLHSLTLRKGDEGGCGVVLTGTRLSLTEEEMEGHREIKAVTYHDVRIRRTRQGFSARVVMDL